jgi:hypothetical protein
MPPSNKEEPRTEPTTVQLWSRRQRLKERRTKIDNELADIDARLKAELDRNQ